MVREAKGQRVIWEPLPGPQTALLTCPIREIFFGGARGGGKTDGALGVCLQHLAQYGGAARLLWLRLTMPELSEAILRSQQIFPAVGFRWKEQSKTWISPSGGFLRFKYLKKEAEVAKYQGHSYTGIVFDELGTWKSPEALAMMWATVRSATGVPGFVLGTGNPLGVGHDWIKKRYIDPAPPLTPIKEDDSDRTRVFIPSKLEDNPYLLGTDYEQNLRLATAGRPWLYAAWRRGDWTAKPAGSLIRAEWFPRFKALPVDEIVAGWSAWDTAFKAKQSNDYSAGIDAKVSKTRLFVVDFGKFRLEYPDLKRKIKDRCSKWKPNELLIEDKASGQSIVQDLKRETAIPVKAWAVKDDLVTRVNAVLALLESGRVLLPETAEWVDELLDGLCLFPNGSHDDDVAAFVLLCERFLKGISNEGLFDWMREEVNKQKEGTR